MDVGCEVVRREISATFDGVRGELSDDVVAAHVAGCVSCRAFEESTRRLRRAAVVRPVQDLPDLSGQVVRRAAADDRSRRSLVVRVLLALCASQIAILAIPDFVTTVPDSHPLRHLGAFSLAYAAGLVVVVIRPARARTMFDVSLVLVAALVVTAVYDIIQGQVPLLSETAHLLEICSSFLLWVLTRPLHPEPATAAGTPSADGGRPPLRPVVDESA